MKLSVPRHINDLETVQIEIELDDTQDPETESDGTTLPCRCPVCNKCRFYISGSRKGTCVHGGPYVGYIEIKEKE